MLFILYCKNEGSSRRDAGRNVSDTVPETMTPELSASTPQNRVLSTGERLLLEAGLREMGISCHDMALGNLIGRGQYGKPFFPSLPNVCFNFSHSGSWVACAFSDREVGLDIQAHDQLRVDGLRIARRFFTDPEYRALLSLSSDQAAMNSLFFRFWTIKEAYLKYVGCGLYAEPDSFLPIPDGHRSEPGGSPCISTGRSVDPDSYFFFPYGRIKILKKKDLLTPGVYALLPAPDGYTMAVSAESLPSQISVRRINTRNQ